MKKEKQFATEADLCRAFIEALPAEWQAYPETCGFDILLARKADGFQIGIEAKLKLNTKVICQVAEPIGGWYACRSGPDCRAVLVPNYARTELSDICKFLGITIISQKVPKDTATHPYLRYDAFFPSLPGKWSDSEWFEFCPEKRCELPDWIPDSDAGTPCPVTLTSWKVKAIKIAITLEKRGFVTRKDFKFHEIDMSRWSQGLWIRADKDGKWIKGANIPDFRTQHPVNYDQIAEDYDKWKSPELLQSAVLA